ncbi:MULTISPECIES: FUSC family protein [unclassified Mycobacterium]|uniref:FUSC family protein n=1 Tax=unclassified Mycobacterium TaxID=2642494 RepID=UPI00068FDCA4|nr:MULTISPECIES: FUSC family protein [unclassified Mycobacterium]SEB23712.1 Fusaric acid resistance protein-like [Mycobacterium sp. 283mftsu]
MRTVYMRVRRAMTPPTEDHRPALRVALGLAIPGVALLAAGRPDLIIYAVFGAITGMYGRTETRSRRFAHQTQGGVILVLGVAIGVALANSHVPRAVLVLAAVAFASVGSVVTDYLALKPEGPFYGVFALGAIATVPAGRVAPSSAILLCAATALLCVLLGVLDAPRAVRPAARLSPPNRRDVLIHAGRYALAITAAGTAGLALGVDHANWAIAAAAGPLAAADASGRIRRGIHRLGGTFIGLAVAAALLVPGPSEYVLAICVMVLLFPTELFMAHHHAVALGFFTPLIMLMTDLAAPTEPLVLLTARGIDTVIGVTAAIVVSMLLPGARD